MARRVTEKQLANLKPGQGRPKAEEGEKGVSAGRVAAALMKRLRAEASRRDMTPRELLELLIAEHCPPLNESMPTTTGDRSMPFARGAGG